LGGRLGKRSIINLRGGGGGGGITSIEKNKDNHLLKVIYF
jgi:hypothetical protein